MKFFFGKSEKKFQNILKYVGRSKKSLIQVQASDFFKISDFSAYLITEFSIFPIFDFQISDLSMLTNRAGSTYVEDQVTILF